MTITNSLQKLILGTLVLVLFLILVSSTVLAVTLQNSSSTEPYAYITNPTNNSVSVIDTATNNVTTVVKVGNHPWGVGVSYDGKKVYVTNVYSNSVSVIDMATNTVNATVKGFKEPWEIAISPDGKKAYIANSDSDKVSVLDTTKNTVTTSVIVGRNPRGVAVTRDGKKVYVTNQKNNNVSVIDTVTNNVIATESVGSQPWGVAVSPDDKTVYAANYGKNIVSVINTGTNNVSARVNVGSNPVEVALTPDGTKAYVTNYGSNTVSVINTATNAVTSTIVVGNMPYGVSFTPNGKKAFIANRNSNNISVIDTETNAVIAAVNVGKSVAFGQFIFYPLTQEVPPVADFSSNVTKGYEPLPVKFTDQSENATKCNWDFGDGENSTDRSPMHSYLSAGNFTVNLTVSNGNCTDSKSMIINVTKVSSRNDNLKSLTTLNVNSSSNINNDSSINIEENGNGGTETGHAVIVSSSGVGSSTEKVNENVTSTAIQPHSSNPVHEQTNENTTANIELTPEQKKNTSGFEVMLGITAILAVYIYRRN